MCVYLKRWIYLLLFIYVEMKQTNENLLQLNNYNFKTLNLKLLYFFIINVFLWAFLKTWIQLLLLIYDETNKWEPFAI